MTAEHFRKEKLYQATMSIARAMHVKGLITKDEYVVVQEMMIAKYNPLLGQLMCSESLI